MNPYPRADWGHQIGFKWTSLEISYSVGWVGFSSLFPSFFSQLVYGWREKLDNCISQTVCCGCCCLFTPLFLFPIPTSRNSKIFRFQPNSSDLSHLIQGWHGSSGPLSRVAGLPDEAECQCWAAHKLLLPTSFVKVSLSLSLCLWLSSKLTGQMRFVTQ